MKINKETDDMNKIEDNTTFVMIGQRYRIDCNKGLWSVEGANREEVVREAKHYFFQYESDGEYDNGEG
jgi:hypothetical protein